MTTVTDNADEARVDGDRSACTQSDPAPQPLTVRRVFTSNRLRILTTYCLFAVENLLRLAQPFALGWAINDLLSGTYTGLLVLIAQHVLHLIVGLARQMFDTRTFTSIYSDIATRMVVRQREAGVAVSQVAARTALSREYVDFYEHSVPLLIRAAFSVAGSLVMLAWYDGVIVATCLALLLPAVFINRHYAGWTGRLSRRLHDELEREVDFIRQSDEAAVRRHFDDVAATRIRLSDAEACNFGLMEVFVLGALVTVLLRACQLPDMHAGDIFAAFRYLMLLLMGLDQLPRVIQQLSRLRDVNDRVNDV